MIPDDPHRDLYDRFFAARSRQLRGRWVGQLRAVVVETNDPLQMYRVRFKCPDLHNWDLEPEECPWAVPDNRMGGKRAGEWTHPCIGDWVWITFERGHPYGPIWTGFANPTRRKLYPYPSVFGITPLPVDEEGNPAEKPQDYNKEYLPRDNRPMSHGVQDRYGNVDMLNSIGFFPVEHKEQPPDPDHDAIQSLNAGLTDNPEEEQETPFDQEPKPPKVNEPDLKYIARISKYGFIVLLGDQGYHWKKDEGLGEFEGDFPKDEQWEIDRWKYIQKLLNEDEPKNTDQRRYMVLTRYGHFQELRDVGWKKTRVGEFSGERRTISKSDKDERWQKFGTKGGWIFQMCDVGFDPEEDKFVKRTLLEDVKHRKEYEDEWETEDKRIARMISRYGFKFVIDDRDSDPKEAEEKELPRARGMLMKGRRTPAAQCKEATGDEKGFFWEFNEKDKANHTTWGTPLGQVVQLSDKYQHIALVSRKSKYPKPWVKYKNAEFHDESLVEVDGIDSGAYHLVLDHHNEYLRLKTRSGKGDSPWGQAVNPPGVEGDEPQGLGCRDGSLGDDPWVELVDNERRGLWFSGKKKFATLRSRYDELAKRFWLYVTFDDLNQTILIRNDAEEGKIQIHCEDKVEVIAKDVNVHAKGEAVVQSDRRTVLAGGGTRFEVRGGKINATEKIYAPDFVKDRPGVPLPDVPEEETITQLEPTNRGERHNKDISCPE